MFNALAPMKKMILTIAIAWTLSLITTLVTINMSLESLEIATGEISDGAIVTAKLANGTVTSAKVLDGTLIAIDLADGCIISAKIRDGAVTTAKLDNVSVTSDKIADDAIVSIKLADGAVTTAKILDGTITAADLATDSVSTIQISDGSVTDKKLSAGAIPFVSTHRNDTFTMTETTDFIDVHGMSVTMTLDRVSHVLVIASLEAFADWDERIYLRALIGEATAHPGEIYLTPVVWASDNRSYFLGYSSYTYHFYLPSASAGTYRVKIQCLVSGGTGGVGYRTLTVIALPA